MTTTTPDLTSQPERFVCPACLTRAMQISVDKKSRPFFFCTGCEATIVLKRSLNPGFAGIENSLFVKEKTMMVLGDAKKTILGFVAALKE